jgi:hypothetical protein
LLDGSHKRKGQAARGAGWPVLLTG